MPTTRPPMLFARWAALLAVFAWGGFVVFGRLNAINVGPDEPVYVNAAWQYIHGAFSLNLEHPPTAKYVIGLFELVMGPTVPAGRLAAACAAFGGGVVIWLWLRGEVGWYGALVPAGIWMLFPRGMVDWQPGTRIDGQALLEPFMVFFAIAAFAAAWKWWRDRSGWWLTASGVLFALSATSKVTTAILAPAFLILFIATRKLRTGLWAAVIFYGAALVTAVLVYLPVGWRGVSYMVSFQNAHNEEGHPTVVAGVVYAHPPWWAPLEFWVQGVGVVALIVLLAGTAAAVFSRPRLLIVFVGTGAVLLLLFYLLVSRITLPHYYYAWTWAFAALAGIGISGLVARFARRQIVAGVLGSLMLVAAVGVAVSQTVDVATARPYGIARIPGELQRHDVVGTVLVVGLSSSAYSPYLTATESTDGKVSAIVVGKSLRNPVPPQVTRFLASHQDAMKAVTLDDVRLYLLDAPAAIAP